MSGEHGDEIEEKPRATKWRVHIRWAFEFLLVLILGGVLSGGGVLLGAYLSQPTSLILSAAHEDGVFSSEILEPLVLARSAANDSEVQMKMGLRLWTSVWTPSMIRTTLSDVKIGVVATVTNEILGYLGLGMFAEAQLIRQHSAEESEERRIEVVVRDCWGIYDNRTVLPIIPLVTSSDIDVKSPYFERYSSTRGQSSVPIDIDFHATVPWGAALQRLISVSCSRTNSLIFGLVLYDAEYTSYWGVVRVSEGVAGCITEIVPCNATPNSKTVVTNS